MPLRAPLSIDPIDYDTMRMRRFRVALLGFFRRWGIYLVVALLVFGAGSNAPLAVAAGAASMLLWPLRIAAEQGWAIVPATLAYAVVGTVPVVCTRQLWWPRHWAEAERALPLSGRTTRRSDLRFGLLVMLPWQTALVVGAIGVATGGASHVSRGGLVVAAWSVAALGSLALSARWMRHVRHAAGTSTHRVRTIRRATSGRPLRAVRATTALLLLPLLRGRATRSAAALVLGTFATSACATGPLWPPVPTGWSLALLAVVALIATSVLRACTARELQPLWRTNRQLPLDHRACERGRIVVVLVPTIVAVVVCLVCGLLASRALRPNVLAAFGLVLAIGAALEATTRETMQPTDHAARWILLLAIAVAFGSEVAPS